MCIVKWILQVVVVDKWINKNHKKLYHNAVSLHIRIGKKFVLVMILCYAVCNAMYMCECFFRTRYWFVSRAERQQHQSAKKQRTRINPVAYNVFYKRCFLFQCYKIFLAHDVIFSNAMRNTVLHKINLANRASTLL